MQRAKFRFLVSGRPYPALVSLMSPHPPKRDWIDPQFLHQEKPTYSLSFPISRHTTLIISDSCCYINEKCNQTQQCVCVVGGRDSAVGVLFPTRLPPTWKVCWLISWIVCFIRKDFTKKKSNNVMGWVKLVCIGHLLEPEQHSFEKELFLSSEPPLCGSNKRHIWSILVPHWLSKSELNKKMSTCMCLPSTRTALIKPKAEASASETKPSTRTTSWNR